LKTCVVIPAFKVEKHILSVIGNIGDCVDRVYVVDDCCPNGSGKLVEDHCDDKRVVVLYNEENLGVGGAVKRGYLQGLADDMEVFVKIDGDGQMDPALLPKFTGPILRGKADYTKGNRFYMLESLVQMPLLRKFGNAGLSLVNKFTSGYWDIMDPTNGYTVIHRTALSLLPLNKISDRYFFESDMLFRLGTLKAVVTDIPMDAVYGTEESHLKISRAVFQFLPLYFRAFWKRIFYTYFLRDFNVASLEMFVGAILFLFGLVFGFTSWINSSNLGEFSSSGTVMLAAVPLIMGFQLLLSALHYDISNIARTPLQSLM